MPDIVKARAAQPCRVEPLEFGVGNVGRHQRDAAIALAGGGDRIDGDGIVAAVAVRLHDHAMLDAEFFMEGKKHFLGGVGGRVVAPVGERKPRARSEHVHMRVAGAGRQLELGFAGRGRPIGRIGGRLGGVLGH